MGTERDTQKSKLYKAEKVLEAFEVRLETTPEMAEFLTKVMNRAPIQRRYGPYLRNSITVKDGRGRSAACGGYGYIKMPKWSRTNWITLHEVAHSLTSRKFGEGVASHGREYAGVYLDLVRFGLGKEAHDALLASFKENRVKYRPKLGRKGRAKPIFTQRVPFKAAAKVKPKAVPTSYEKAWSRQTAQARRKVQAIAKEFGFTYKITREGTLAWFETDDFPVTGLPFSTMHYGWVETLERVEKCIEDPLLIDSGGGYSE